MGPFNRYARKVWYRDAVVWSRYWWTSLVGALGEPVLYFLAIGYGLGSFIESIEGMPYLKFLAPALLCSTVMHSASFETTYSSFTRMDRQKTYHSIVATPVQLSEVVAGEILWGATKALIPGGVMFLAIWILGFVDSVQALWLIPVLAVEAMLFSSLGMLMTSYAKDYDFFTYYFTLGLEPMFLFSGTFFPLTALPPVVQKIAWLLPLAHPVAIARGLLTDYQAGNLLLSLVWLVLVTVSITAWTIRRMVRRLLV